MKYIKNIDIGNILKALCLALPGLFVAAFATAVRAEPAAGLDAILLIDSSGSMKQTDPRRLRVPAAKLFINLLGDTDRVAIVSFSDDGYPIARLTSADAAHRNELFAAVEKVSARGAYTNLHAALTRGLSLVDAEPNDRRVIFVLMSDGRMDVGDAERDAALMNEIRGPLLAELKRSNIEVYTLAFTEASDLSLMQALSDGTGGFARLASNDRQLHEAFSAIFERAKAPDMLPIEGGKFLVDEAVDEVTVVATREQPGDEIALLTPDGKKITRDAAGIGVRWFVSEQFDMITLAAPEPGEWQLLSTGANNRAYVVTNLGLDARLGEIPQGPGDSAELTAWLEENGELLDKPAFLEGARFRAEIAVPDQAVQTLELEPVDRDEGKDVAGGLFGGAYTFADAGSYRIRVVAEGPTFRREKPIYVDIARPADAEPVPAPAPEPVVQVEAPVVQAEVEPPVAGPQPEPAAEAGINVGLVISLFVLFNLLLGMIVAGVMFWRGRAHAPPAPRATGEAS